MSGGWTRLHRGAGPNYGQRPDGCIASMGVFILACALVGVILYLIGAAVNLMEGAS